MLAGQMTSLKSDVVQLSAQEDRARCIIPKINEPYSWWEVFLTTERRDMREVERDLRIRARCQRLVDSREGRIIEKGQLPHE